MDELKKHFATDTEFEIALYILDTLNEQPQVFMVEDVLKQLYEKFGKDTAKYHLCNFVFNKMKGIGYITSFDGAVKLADKGVSCLVAYKTQPGFLHKMKRIIRYPLYIAPFLMIIGSVFTFLFGSDRNWRFASNLLISIGAVILAINLLLEDYIQNHSNKSGGG